MADYRISLSGAAAAGNLQIITASKKKRCLKLIEEITRKFYKNALAQAVLLISTFLAIYFKFLSIFE
jgi:hypothetical protein